ncbi:MAG: 6-phosphofructokinase [Planctomycetes bacterium]|nr:6-phosphofructokinase [Planctomycetota bacterium]
MSAKPRPRRIAILTGGGDCPGLNAVIRAVVKSAVNVHGWEVFGVRDGVEGFLVPGGRGLFQLGREDIAGILPRGGTILGASNRLDIFRVRDSKGREHDKSAKVGQILASKKIDTLITVGGDGTQTMALKFARQGINVIGVPKTIDNDLAQTDRTFGFDTAVGVVAGAIDRLYTTAESHHRVMLVEVMGRHTGWIALHGGLAGGAEVILIPEIPYDPQRIADYVALRARHGRRFSIVVVAEGAARPDGDLVWREGDPTDMVQRRLGGVAWRIADELEALSDLEVRPVVLGHVQRGGSPSPYDRVLASRMGAHAVSLIAAGKSGRMVALRGTQMTDVALASAVRKIKSIDPKGQLVRSAREMGISFAAADGSDDAWQAGRVAGGL